MQSNSVYAVKNYVLVGLRLHYANSFWESSKPIIVQWRRQKKEVGWALASVRQPNAEGVRSEGSRRRRRGDERRRREGRGAIGAEGGRVCPSPSD